MADPQVLVRGGRVIDATGERVADVRIVGGVVTEVAPSLAPEAGSLVLDAEGCVVAPGLVDIQVHFREPGREDAETIETGARAAAKGGFTAVVCMPNTDPPLDDAAVVQAVLERGRYAACDVRVAGCITKGRRGEELAPLGELYDRGVRVFTDDGDCVADALVMRRAFEYALALPGAVLSQHAEDPSLVAGGHMNEGEWSARLGIPGRPAEAEISIVARDLTLARVTGGRYHVLHLSTAGAAALVRAAKAEGVRVTAECTPQHVVLTDALCASFDPVFKMNPPLRTAADVDALKAALADGTIDAIATDHAPHAPETKEVPFEEAPPGMLGVETALGVAITQLVEPGVLSMQQALAALSWKPARIAGLDAAGHGGPIEPGHAAHLCVFDPNERWVVDASRLASKSRNSPFDGWKLAGRVRHTLLRGVPMVRDGEAQR
ncbi:MAG: dihydroorotase, multifunctional complex type [Actinomycetia bacterium]|nr:dihydroorotase, multifunctional complex type [Actinomycetes bacterium]